MLLLLWLRGRGVVPSNSPVARVFSFCYDSGGMVFGAINAGSSESAWFWFHQKWLVVVSLVLFRLILASQSRCCFSLIGAGLLLARLVWFEIIGAGLLLAVSFRIGRFKPVVGGVGLINCFTDRW